MKKSIYFTTTQLAIGQLQQAVESATSQRDIWISENKSKIGKIDFEDINFIPSNNGAHIAVVVQLAYFEKES